MEDVLEGEIHAKRRRMDQEGGTSLAQSPDIPGVTVSPNIPKHILRSSQRHSYCRNACASHHVQVDGSNEDWLEVLRLMYYSGGVADQMLCFCVECAHSSCCTFLLLHIPLAAHSSCCTFLLLHIPLAA